MTRPEYLHATDLDPVTGATGDEIWAFFMACHDGNLAEVKLLTAEHPNLFQASIHYYTPLHFALRENHLDITRHLLDLGASPFLDDFTYSNLRDLLEERNQTEVLNLLDSRIAATHTISKEAEPLAQFIRERNLPAVIQLLDEKPHLIHTGDRRANLPLHWAVMTRNLPLIDLLLDRGANIDAIRADGARPINLTNGDYYYRGWRDVPSDTLRPHHVLIGYLLARGANYDISTAARLGDLDQVKRLISQVNELPPYNGFYNSAPLRNAAGQGHFEVVKYLLEQGANPNLPEPIAPHGAALRDAIGGQHWEIVKILIHYGANVNSMVDSSGNCVWAAKDAPEEIQQLIAAKGGILGVNIACYDLNYDYIEATLQANPNEQIHEHLPLNDKRMVEVALKYQPDVLSKCVLPANTSIDHARWLLDNGLNPSLCNWLGVTPLHECAKLGNTALAQLLLAHGADPNAIDDHFRETPQQWASRFRSTH
jgi:ankyrin repeat protein